jgi:hypothetical protein
MAIGAANISRGMGRGAAQVYDTSAPINMYAKLMQQQQLKRAAETKALTDEFGKLTPEGIRQQDIPIFVEQVGKWKNASIEANNERDPVKKAIKTQEAEQEKLKAYALKDYSKSEGKKRSDFASSMLIPNNRDNFTPEAIDIFRETDKYSVNDPRYLSDLTTLQQQIDGSTTMAEIAKINKVLLDAAQPTRVERRGNEGNRVGTFVTYNKQIPPQQQIDAMSLAFRVSPKLRAGLRQIYPEHANKSNDEFIATVIPDYVNKNPATEYGEEKFKPDKDLTMQNLRIQRERRLAAGEGGDFPEDYVVERIQLTTEPQDDKDGEPIIGTEKPSLTLEKTVKVRSVPFPSTQMKAFDVANNKRIVLSARQDLKLARLAYVPTIAKDGRYELQAVVIDSQNKQYVIQETEVPIDIRRTKAYKAAKTALGSPPPPKGAKAKPTTQPATATTKPTTSNIATPKSFVYSATSGNNKVYSNDGKTWYTKDGKKIQ